MPKVKTDLKEKYLKYVKEFGDHLLKYMKDCDELFCLICNKEIKNSFKKSSIRQHLETQKHLQKEIDLKRRQSTAEQSIDAKNGIIGESIDKNRDILRKNSEQNLVNILELIKENVKKLINNNNNKRETNDFLKNETKVLVENYDKMRLKFDKQFETELDLNKCVFVKKTQTKLQNSVNNSNKKVIKSIKREGKAENRRYKCVDCNGKQWKSWHHFKAHRKLHLDTKLGLIDRGLVCDWDGCGQSFKLTSQLRQHKRLEHLNVWPFRCDTCLERFRTEEALQTHVDLCRTTVDDNMFKCNQCQRTYSCRPNLLRHKKQIHLQHMSYECEHCGQGFIRKEILLTHRLKVHQSDADFHRCSWPGCNYRTVATGMLTKHSLTHTGDRPHVCSWPECGLRFRQSHHLKVHLLKHTGEKPFQCHKCEQRFQSRQQLRIHCAKRHPEVLMTCEMSEEIQ